MKIKKGDKVKVIAGRDKGKTGTVLQVFPADNKLSVEGVNLRWKHMRSNRQDQKGQKIQFPALIDASNVMVIAPKSGKPTRISHKVTEGGKVRYSKKHDEVI